MNNDILKALIPFITFLLGIVLTPLIEYLKEKSHRNRMFNNLNDELEDEITQLHNRITMMANAVDSLTKLQSKDKSLEGPLFYLPRETKLYFAKVALEEHYSYLSREKRITIKAIQSQINALNGYCKELEGRTTTEENIEGTIKIKKKFIYTSCCLRYNMKYVLHPKHNAFHESVTDKEIINDELEELKIDLTFDLLLNKKSITIK